MNLSVPGQAFSRLDAASRLPSGGLQVNQTYTQYQDVHQSVDARPLESRCSAVLHQFGVSAFKKPGRQFSKKKLIISISNIAISIDDEYLNMKYFCIEYLSIEYRKLNIAIPNIMLYNKYYLAWLCTCVEDQAEAPLGVPDGAAPQQDLLVVHRKCLSVHT